MWMEERKKDVEVSMSAWCSREDIFYDIICNNHPMQFIGSTKEAPCTTNCFPSAL